ncbi:DUF1552 domain-containing protein [Sorangium sp. So ce136]|uniref:DUF1552 domain-containing protein n=1 Tax=Sorangium sp. So ce136 TaxID=3133284 RepID=UPI003EFF9987
MTSGRLSRRRFLASAGLTISLPLLPSLMHTPNAAAAPCGPVRRFVAYMFPNGHHMPEHMASGTGSGSQWSLPPMLASMKDLKSELVFVSGLENQERRKEFGDHAIGCGALLTARKPTKNKPFTSMSVDQVIADAQADCGQIHSLQLGTHDQGPADQFGTYYTRNISWRGPSIKNGDGSMSFPAGDATPLGKEIDPRRAFDRLFAGSDTGESAAQAEMRRALKKSVLDAVVPHQGWLERRLNAADRVKVDELFTGIRELERDLMSVDTGPSCTPPSEPTDIDSFAKKLDYMHTLMAVALQCDITRVITFMMGDALSNRDLSFIPDVASRGGDAGDHSVSHHSGRDDLEDKFRVMVLWKMEQIAAFLRRLSKLTDFDGQPLLDNTLVWISSEIADGNRHNHDDKPILLAGRLGGLVTPDRHVRFPTSRDPEKVKTYGDFFITLLDMYGVRVNEFGNDGKEAIVWQK